MAPIVIKIKRISKKLTLKGQLPANQKEKLRHLH